MSDSTASSNDVVLAFSGGLDTSFCVPWLKEKGFSVTTVFVNTGGQSDAELKAIEARAAELGAARHITADAEHELWHDIVVPLVQAGEWYRGQYPLLCSDRYLVVAKALAVCDELGTRRFAHGCTGAGNDQVRFDLAVRALGDYAIIAPVRELQDEVDHLREYEQRYLTERGFDVPEKSTQYTINQNLLGATVSGSEIDAWDAPGDDTYQLCAKPEAWPREAHDVTIAFEHGVAVALDGEALPGPDILARLNALGSRYGLGRGVYTGDTCVGLKGRIVFEAPGIVTLAQAHRALEQATCTRSQNDFKPLMARRWTELVYQGLYFDPLRSDLEQYLSASQRSVTGAVTLRLQGGQAHAVRIDSAHLLERGRAQYAQRADWSRAEAEGFIRLTGQSSELWAAANADPAGSADE
ncbi:MAG: argininosuccinate synthase [Pseudomonadota bacterium]